MAKKLEFTVDANTGKAVKHLGEMADAAIKGADQSEKAFRDVGSAAERAVLVITGINQATQLVGKGFSTLKTLALGPISAFKTLNETSFSLVEAYDVQARAVLSLGVAMKNAGQFSKESVKDFEQFASSLQQVTNVGDEVILQNQAVLGSFVGFGQGLKDATRAALDLAAGFGINTESAFRKFIKAAQSGNLELAEGVSIALKSTTAQGRLAEAVAEVEKRFGGFAETLAKIGTGPITALRNALSDAFEPIGAAIRNSNEFEAFLKTATIIVNSFARVIGENLPTASALFGQVFTRTMAAAQVSVKVLLGALSQIRGVVLKIVDVLDIDTPLEKAVAASKQAFNDLSKVAAHDFDKTRDSVFSLFDAIERLGTNVDKLSDEQLTALANAAQRTFDDIATRSDISFGIDLAHLDPEAFAQADNLLRTTNAAKALADSLKELVKQRQADAELAALESEANKPFSELFDDLAGKMESAGVSFKGFTDTFTSELAKARAEGGTDLARGLDELGKTGSDSLEGIRRGAEGAGGALGDAAGSADRLKNALEFGRAEGLADSFVGDKAALESNFEAIGQAANRIFSSIQDSADKLDFSRTFGDISSLLTDLGAAGAKLSQDFLDEFQARMLEAGQATPAVLQGLQDIRDELQNLDTIASQLDGTKIKISADIDAAIRGTQGQQPSWDELADAASASLDAAKAIEESATDGGAVTERAAEASLEASSNMQISAEAHESAAASLASSGSVIDQASRSLATSGSDLKDASSALQRASEGLERNASVDVEVNVGGDFKGAAQALNGSASALTNAAGDISRAADRLGNSSGAQLGGIVTAPSIRRVGEAGPEAIIPLNPRGASFLTQLSNMLGGGPSSRGAAGAASGGVQVYVTGGTFLGIDDLAKEIEDAIATKLYDTSEVRL